jgi:hypothetical protein
MSGASRRQEEVVDFGGTRPHLIEPATGDAVAVEIFVGALEASALIDADATRRQDLASCVS